MNPAMMVHIQRLDPHLPMPRYACPGDAGFDLYAADDVVLIPFQRTLVPTGIALAIPSGYAGFIMPRSGHALRLGLSIVNAPGLIDSRYRGEIKVLCINLDPANTIELARGTKIAQLVIQPVVHSRLGEVDKLDTTERGEGGFGSTGI